MKRDRIDTILQLAYLDGKITTKGLIEKVVMRRQPGEKMSDEKTEQLHIRLCAALEERHTSEAMKGALTLGEYISNEVSDHPASDRRSVLSVLAKKAGCTVTQISDLCRDRLSPLEIAADGMKALLQHMKIPSPAAVVLLQNSIRCSYLELSLASTLARYDSSKGGRKSQAMRRAVRELYIKAEVVLPQAEEQRINDYVRHATADLEQ